MTLTPDRLAHVMRNNKMSWSSQDINEFVEVFKKAGYLDDNIDIYFMSLHQQFWKNGIFNVHYVNSGLGTGVIEVSLWYDRRQHRIGICP